MTCFFQRGGAWVLGQSVLLAAVGLLAPYLRGDGFLPAGLIAGVILMGAGTGVLFAGMLALGRNLTPFPKPAKQAQLVRHGIYARLRHPLYTGVVALALGWALVWQSSPALLAAALLVPFFDAKARREEHWLREKFAAYAAYQRQTCRFIPWLY